MKLIVGVQLKFGVCTDNDLAVVLNSTEHPVVMCTIYGTDRVQFEDEIRTIAKCKLYGDILDTCDLSTDVYDLYIEYDISTDKFTCLGNYQDMNPHLFVQY